MGVSVSDLHSSFLARSLRGSRERGLQILKKLNAMEGMSESHISHRVHDSGRGEFVYKNNDAGKSGKGRR